MIRHISRDYFFFLLATVFIGIGQSVDGATLTNYLKENLGMLVLERSALEFPRELPGLVVVIIIGVLSSWGDVRISVIANILSALGMLCLSIIPPHYNLVVMTMFVYSLGSHMYMPMSNSIGMSFAATGGVGRKLGQMNAVNTLALVAGSAMLWALFKFVQISYTISFGIGAVAFLLAAVCLCFVNPVQHTKTGGSFVFRREYGLYYWLCMLYGARKQIFITFGPWVLVDVLHQPVTTMTALFFIVSVTGIFVKPWIGYMIDHLGEKFILSGEAMLFFFICLGYAFASDLFSAEWALLVICSCYILDQTMSAVSMARATYMKKLALIPEHLSPSLSLGTSIDHIVTMFLPILGGLVWYNNGPNGYKYVFLGGAAIAVLNFISTQFICLDKEKSVITRV